MRVAAVQMNSRDDKAANLAKAEALLAAGQACYGNALIVDPWGVVLARAGYQECVVSAEIDLDYQQQVRKELPSLEHRRTDLFAF